MCSILECCVGLQDIALLCNVVVDNWWKIDCKIPDKAVHKCAHTNKNTHKHTHTHTHTHTFEYHHMRYMSNIHYFMIMIYLQWWSPRGQVLGLEAPWGHIFKSLVLRVKSLTPSLKLWLGSKSLHLWAGSGTLHTSLHQLLYSECTQQIINMLWLVVMCRSDCLCTRSRLCLNHVLCYCDVLEMNVISRVIVTYQRWMTCHLWLVVVMCRTALSLSKEKTLNQPRTLLCVLFVEHRCNIHFPCQVCSSLFIVKIIQVHSRFPIVRHLCRVA
jgi:hypothetical protein